MKDCRLLLGAGLLWLVLMLANCGDSAPSTPEPPGPPPALTLNTVASGLSSPVDLQFPPGDSTRLFVVEQPGTIRIVANGSLISTPFLDIQSKLDAGGEKGLLGLAFHPSFSQNRRFYVNYTRLFQSQLQSVIAEYLASASDQNQADVLSERILLTVDQPFENHKAGQLAFGPDGFLYIAFGDGGSGGDPMGNGQSLQTLLGKMLRIDVDHTTAGQYAIPADNPFASGGGLPEIWAYGFRNPWRFSFEKIGARRLFCADVGQDQFEEINVLASGGNFGWNVMEGAHCYNATSCNMTGLTLPIFEYGRSEGQVVIGGYVYTGSAISNLSGAYLFSDFNVGKIWSLTEGTSGAWTRSELLSTGRGISSFGQDADGEIYVADYSGEILKLVTQ